MFDPFDEAAESGEALPKGFYAGFAIAFAGEEAAKHGDAADDIAYGRHFLGGRFFSQQPCGLPFSLVEHSARGQVGLDTSQAHQMSQSPGNDKINGQRDLQLLDMAQLQRFDPATILEHMKQGFDFPAAAIPPEFDSY